MAHNWKKMCGTTSIKILIFLHTRVNVLLRNIAI